ncbi:MAG: zf-TFIIB domain-containing protein [Bacteroidales bacterium]|nr:zf-TFIIB domain-containing protein [Bacteroidales bacterium]
MKSPVSREPMLVLELAGVEIDYCPESGGIWLDAGELEVLFDDRDAADELISSLTEDTTSREKKLRCPICRKKMEKVLVENKVLIDSCRKGHGLWFDEGELIEVLELEQKGGGGKVIGLLKEMFANHISKETPE